MQFDASIERQLVDRTLSLVCFTMSIRQRKKLKPFKFTGPGTIYHDESGNLRAKFYDKSKSSSDPSMLEPFLSSKIGLVPEEDYYNLRARDASGNLWTAKRIHISNSLHTTPFGTVFDIELDSLESKKPVLSGPSIFHASILLRGNLDLPFNKFLPTHDGSSALRGLDLSLTESKYLFDQRSDSLHIAIESSTKPISRSYADRLIEALYVACGKRLETVYIRTSDKRYTLSTLSNRKLTGTTKLPNVIPMRVHQTEPFKEFLDTYIKNRRADHDKMFRLWERLTESAAYSETSALVVSINVEGMIKFYHRADDSINADLANNVSTAKRAIKAAKLDDRIHARLMQVLSDLNKKSVSRKIKDLVDLDVISTAHLAAWTKLRNSTAHADSLASEDSAIIDFFNNQSLCIDLFYILICQTINYHGARNKLDTKLLPHSEPDADITDSSDVGN